MLNNNYEYEKSILRFFLFLFIVSLLMMGWLLWPFLSSMIIGAVITGIFKPFYLICRTKMPAVVSSFLTCFLIFIVVFVPIALFVGILSKEAYDLYLMGKNAVLNDQIKEIMGTAAIVEHANKFLMKFNFEITGEEFNRVLSEALKTVGFFIYQQAGDIGKNILNFIIYFLFMLLIIFYLLIDGKKLLDFLVDLSPLPDDQDNKLIDKFRDMAGAILIGNGIGGLIQGFFGGLVFFSFGFKSSLVWGVILAILAFLPIIGIGVVFIPAAIYLILADRIWAALFFIAFYIIFSMGTEYIFKPRLVGKKVKMHTLLVFLAIVGGLKMFGILGIIYGPLIVTGFLTLNDIYYSNYRKQTECITTQT